MTQHYVVLGRLEGDGDWTFLTEVSTHNPKEAVKQYKKMRERLGKENRRIEDEPEEYKITPTRTDSDGAPIYYREYDLDLTD